MIVGVLSDTHIPDRARRLNPRVLELFRAARVQAILHAGDICIPSVLEELGRLAPVTAVRGNRDWSLRASLPIQRELTFSDVQVGLVHGHGSLYLYLLDKLQYIASGYRLERYQRLLLRTLPNARVIVFGHTHYAENHWEDGVLIFNPGSACCPDSRKKDASIGILRFFPGQQVVGEILPLD
jgi:putative phosphoesterase